MKKLFVKISVLIMCMCAMVHAGAAETLSLSHNMIKNNMLYVYVENPGKIESVRCQIGLENTSDVDVKEITDADISLSTYILIDNSLSIQEEYRDMMKQVAKDIILAGKSNENFTVATFDTEIHYLTENSRELKELLETVEQIEFENLDTQITDVLYHLYEKLDDGNENSFKRIILMSDGVETKTIGYTKEELIEKVKNVLYPVYMLGCTYKSNEAELENMFRISRETNAKYYHLAEVESADQVAAEIQSSFDLIQVRAEIPNGQRDGSSKGIRIVFQTSEGEKAVSFGQTMPFYTDSFENMTEEQSQIESDRQTESIHELTERITEAVTEKTTESVAVALAEGITEFISEDVNEAAETNDRKVNFFMLGGIAAAICIVAIAGVAFWLIRKRKIERGSMEKETIEDISGNTEWLSEEDDDSPLYGETIRLTDTSRAEVMREYSLISSVIIGRDVNKSQLVFDYEKSVSRAHCEIYKSGEKIYIRDLNSVNLTYVNGTKVEEKTELPDGAIIKMGRLMLKFEIVNTDPKNKSERKTNTEYMFNF